MENLEKYLKKLGDEKWRDICNSIVYVRCPAMLETLAKAGFEVDSRNDGFICVCFIDHMEGMSFYVIAAAHIRNENIFICKENKSSQLIIRMQALKECLYLNQNYMNMDFLRWDSYIRSVIHDYEEPYEEAVEIRDIMELDEFRNPVSPDEIEVLLIGKETGQERVMVRAEKYGDNCLKGILLNEPESAIGIHKGDEIDFMLVEREGGFSTVHVC